MPSVLNPVLNGVPHNKGLVLVYNDKKSVCELCLLSSKANFAVHLTVSSCSSGLALGCFFFPDREEGHPTERSLEQVS